MLIYSRNITSRDTKRLSYNSHNLGSITDDESANKEEPGSQQDGIKVFLWRTENGKSQTTAELSGFNFEITK